MTTKLTRPQPMSGGAMLELYLQDILFEAEDHRRVEECLAANMEPTPTDLNQQGHSELHKKISSVFESWWWTL